MDKLVPEFVATPVDTIPQIAQEKRNAFNSQTTKPIEWRLKQLRKLYWGIVDNEPAIVEACKRDLGKSLYETYLAEIDWCKNDIVFVSNNLAKWAKDESAQDIELTMKLVSPKIRKDPLGAVLVIGAYNYPMQLSLGPFIGAICAGNTGILKPSEQAPNVAAVLGKIIGESLDPACFSCVQGGVPETTALLDQKWDKIFYTGSPGVGRIIARKAAETLTPTTLELGGKNPAIVARTADARLAARRMLWTKIHNAGQICISQNYVLVDREILPALRRELQAALAEFMPIGAKDSPDYGRIATGRQWTRLKGLLEQTHGKIIAGGTMDEASRFLEPTVVEVEDASDILIQEETFGPIVTLLPVSGLDEAIRVANEVDPTPLGAYPFGSRRDTDRVLRELRSGGATVNDAMFHGALPTMPFGGVGGSGQGAYRGKASFDCFTHRRSIVTTPGWMEKMLAVRYPPYAGKLQQFQRMNNRKPNFDRNGNVRHGLIRLLLTLGAGSATGGLARYAFIILAAAGIKQYLDMKAKL